METNKKSWADEVESSCGSDAQEEEDVHYPEQAAGDDQKRGDNNLSGRNSPREENGKARVGLPLRPPFVAFVGNLPFSTDEEMLGEFFCGGNCDVIHVIIHRDYGGRARGMAHVEFADRASLELALGANGVQFQGRTIRVDVDIKNNRSGVARGGRGHDRPHRDDFDRNRNSTRSERFPPRQREEPKPPAPPSRPILRLQERTRPLDEIGKPVGSKADIFGGARPNDIIAYEEEKRKREEAAKAKEAAEAEINAANAVEKLNIEERSPSDAAALNAGEKLESPVSVAPATVLASQELEDPTTNMEKEVHKDEKSDRLLERGTLREVRRDGGRGYRGRGDMGPRGRGEWTGRGGHGENHGSGRGDGRFGGRRGSRRDFRSEGRGDRSEAQKERHPEGHEEEQEDHADESQDNHHDDGTKGRGEDVSGEENAEAHDESHQIEGPNEGRGEGRYRGRGGRGSGRGEHRIEGRTDRAVDGRGGGRGRSDGRGEYRGGRSFSGGRGPSSYLGQRGPPPHVGPHSTNNRSSDVNKKDNKAKSHHATTDEERFEHAQAHFREEQVVISKPDKEAAKASKNVFSSLLDGSDSEEDNE